MKNLIFPNKKEMEPILQPNTLEQNYRGLGGEIFHRKQKTEKIVWGIVGVLTFALFNLVIHLLTKL